MNGFLLRPAAGVETGAGKSQQNGFVGGIPVPAAGQRQTQPSGSLEVEVDDVASAPTAARAASGGGGEGEGEAVGGDTAARVEELRYLVSSLETEMTSRIMALNVLTENIRAVRSEVGTTMSVSFLVRCMCCRVSLLPILKVTGWLVGSMWFR